MNLPGQNQLGTHFDKQFALASTVIHPDSILAFGNEPVVVGKVTDGLLGTISATHYTEIGLNGTNVSFDITPGQQADSMVLVMNYTGYYYGDTTKTIKLEVRKLKNGFVNEKTYFINDKIEADDLLGTIEFKPKSNRVPRGNKDDSRLIRIRLDRTFATSILSQTFATQADFKNFWKGIAITPASNSASGSLVGFNTFPDTAGTTLGKVAGINLYFKDDKNEAKFHNFTFSGQFFNGIEVTRQGALDGVAKNSEVPSLQTSNVTYIQANSGVKTRLIFPNLDKFKETKGNVYINHAELILPVKPGTFNVANFITPLPQSIFLYESTAGKRVRKTAGDQNLAMTVQAGNVSAFNLTTPAIGVYNSDSLHYKTNITSYVQAIIDQKKPNDGIIISPTAEDKTSASGAGLTYPGTLNLNRALIDAGNKKIVLRIYYSQLK